MGVKGLWRLVEEAGTPVPLESLENKILAVDVSIWLHQAVRGFRGVGGDAVANSHLLTLFHRICKLLFYRIKPVFVFDGGVPHLKKQTQSFRRIRREAAANRADRIRERLLNNLLKSHAVRQALGRTGPAPSQHKVLPAPKPRQKDMFELPPLPEGETLGGEAIKKEPHDSFTSKRNSSEDEEEDSENSKKRLKIYHHKNLHNFDLDSEEFRSLPIQQQHEILVELQDSRKDNSWASINSMPSESSGFASYQMERLLKRFKFQETIDNVRSAIQKQKSDELEKELFGNLEKHVSQTHKIASEDAAHSIFINKAVVEAPEEENRLIKVDKGKSLMKKPQKDFLQELMKEGIIGNPHLGISDSEESSDEDSIDTTQLNEESEDNALVYVMNSAMSDNSGLTQDEILNLIHQSKQEVDSMITGESKPSTSRNASGVVCNTEAESSDSDNDDDFVEVPPLEDHVRDSVDCDLSPTGQTCSEERLDETIPSSQENSADKKNIDAIRSSKSSSLYIKIVQHRLNDIIEEDDNSPRKAKVDSRKLKKATFPRQNSFSSSTALADRNSTVSNGITLSFDIKQSRQLEDDIFSDIFSPAAQLQNSNKSSTSGTVDKIPKEKRKSPISNQVKDTKEAKKMVVNTSTVSSKSDEKDSVQYNLQRKVDELVKQQLTEILRTKKFSSDIEVPDLDCIKTTSSEVLATANISENEVSDRCDKPADSVVNVQMAKSSSQTSLRSLVNFPQTISAASEVDSDEDNDFIEVHQSTLPSNDASVAAPPLRGTDPAKDLTTTLTRESSTEIEVNNHFKTTKSPKRSLDTQTDMPVVTSSDLTVLATKKPKVVNTLPTDKELEDNVLDVIDGNLPTEENNSVSNSENKIVPIMGEPESNPKQPSAQLSPNNDANGKAVDDDFEESNEDDLKKIEEELVKEQKNLVAQAQKGDRIASNLSQQMYTDAQELLQLFGLPYLVAPMEAEAQCAFLDEVGLTNGTITDDSDAFLFGSKHVYKNFFNQSQHVELYKLDNIRIHFGLDREKMIALALLTGSDYTVGIEGVGAVSGMEILAEFPGKGIEILQNFKKWWVSYGKGVSALKLSKLREKLSKVYLPEGFPNAEVFTAYLEPDIDHSREKFEWSVPNTDALREFAAEKLGWSRSKTNEILVPVMKRLSIKSSQTRIDTFFNNVRLVKDTKVTSKRLQEAIARSRGEVVGQSKEKADDNLMDKINKEQGRKRKTAAKTKVKKNSHENLKGNDTATVSTRPANKPTRQTRKGSSLQESSDGNESSAGTSQTLSSKAPLSKEEKKKQIYQHLLQKKEEIAQRKAAEIEMLRKKQHAALLLKKKSSK